MSVVTGYMVGNDVSERRWQKSDKQFYRAVLHSFFPAARPLSPPMKYPITATSYSPPPSAGSSTSGPGRRPDPRYPEFIAYIFATKRCSRVT